VNFDADKFRVESDTRVGDGVVSKGDSPNWSGNVG